MRAPVAAGVAPASTGLGVSKLGSGAVCSPRRGSGRPLASLPIAAGANLPATWCRLLLGERPSVA